MNSLQQIKLIIIIYSPLSLCALKAKWNNRINMVHVD